MMKYLIFLITFIFIFLNTNNSVYAHPVDESENELSINAENSKSILRIYNSERNEGDTGGPPGKIISVSVTEKYINL